MRINNNMMAMNTHRQLGAANAGSAKSIGKLSSGYRINSAADDAAGLAISEKMRGQIRGLNQASSNAQDGISMIQTAEGALNETHSILQRMRELAVQAGNDTNVGVDREEIQKEMNQLTSEINRIGNTTEFNTQKVLNGGGEVTEAKVNSMQKGAAAGALKGMEKIGAKHEIKATAGSTEVEVLQNAAAEWTGAVTSTIAQSGIDTFSFEFEGVTVTVKGVVGSGSAGAVTNMQIADGAVTLDIDSNDAAGVTATNIADAVKNALVAYKADSTYGDAGNNANAGKLKDYTIDTTSDVNIKITADAKLGDTKNSVGYGGTIAMTSKPTKATTEGVSAATQTIDFGAENGSAANYVKVKYAHANTDTAPAISFANTKEVTITLGNSADKNTTGEIQNALRLQKTDFAALGIDSSKIKVSGDDIGGYTTDALEANAKNNNTVAGGEIGQTIDFGGDNGKAADGFKVVYEKASGGNLAAAFNDTTNTVTISLGDKSEKNTAKLIEEKLQAITNFGDDIDASKITVEGDVAGIVDAAALTTAATTASAVTSKFVKESISLTESTKSVKAVAAEWNTGDLAKVLANATGKIKFGDVTLDIKGAAAGAGHDGTTVQPTGIDVVLDSDKTAAEQAQQIVDAFKAVQTNQGSGGSLKDFTFEVAGNGIKITGKAENGDKNNTAKIETEGITIANSGADSLATKGVKEARGEYSFEIDKAFEKEGVALEIGGKTFTAVTSGADSTKGQFNIGTDKEAQAVSLAAALNSSDLNGRFDAIVDGGKITLREKSGKATGEAVEKGKISDGTNTAVQSKVSFTVDQPVAVGGRYSVGGADITVTDDASHKGLSNGTAVMYSEDTTQQASNLANAIASNASLSDKYKVEVSANRVTLEQKEGKESIKDASIETSTSKNSNFQATFQVGANSGQGMTIEVDDMRSAALGISAKESGASATAKNGVKASYVANSNVSNGTDNTTTEFSLDVSTHEKATAAISVLNDAIETVSAERSKLGSFQNRLEHSIKNLDTSSENLQSAESRIRDVDMAKEMMEQTKQNILSQAATAMLAQANQAPQGVLQLLR